MTHDPSRAERDAKVNAKIAALVEAGDGLYAVLTHGYLHGFQDTETVEAVLKQWIAVTLGAPDATQDTSEALGGRETRRQGHETLLRVLIECSVIWATAGVLLLAWNIIH